MDLGRQKHIVIFALIIILALMIGYNVVYKYNLSEIESIKAKIEDEKKKNEILEFISILDEKLQNYRVRSFSTTEITQLVDQISQLAKKVGIAVETFKPFLVINREYYIEMPLEIPLKCEYHQLGKLLSLIESSQEFIWIKRLKMQKTPVAEGAEAKIPEVTLVISGLYLEK